MGRSHLCSSLWNVQIIRWITSSLRHIAVLRNITVVSYKFCWILYCWLGNNIIWYWIFLGHHRMAYIRNDIGGLWLYCALQVNWALPVLLLFCDLINYSPLFISVCFFFLFLQWVLANTGCFSAEDTCSWMDISATIYSICMLVLQLSVVSLVFTCRYFGWM